MDGALLRRNRPADPAERMSLHGPTMCRVRVDPAATLLALAGSMVAYEGLVDFDPNPPSARSRLTSFATGEGLALMQVSGEGTVYLADYGRHVVVLRLGDTGLPALSVNGRNVLAFESALEWSVERVKGVSVLGGTGLFNVVLRGTGWVALACRGTPVTLDASEAPTYVDPDALVAFSEGLTVSTRRTARLGALVGRGSGEAVQLAFAGTGLVVVQPSEDARPALALRG